MANGKTRCSESQGITQREALEIGYELCSTVRGASIYAMLMNEHVAARQLREMGFNIETHNAMTEEKVKKLRKLLEARPSPPNTKIARDLGVSVYTVDTWKRAIVCTDRRDTDVHELLRPSNE